MKLKFQYGLLSILVASVMVGVFLFLNTRIRIELSTRESDGKIFGYCITYSLGWPCTAYRSELAEGGSNHEIDKAEVEQKLQKYRNNMSLSDAYELSGVGPGLSASMLVLDFFIALFLSVLCGISIQRFSQGLSARRKAHAGQE